MVKMYKQIAGILVMGMLLLPFAQPIAHAQDAIVSYQTFYDELAPYGQWVNDPAYGNVWVPNVEPGFRPYATDGHWAMTDNGNMWVSESPWGWACYHYGRWTYSSYYGWLWIPGHEWAPAWVSWRSGGGYYGWAPMGPGYVPGRPYEYPDNYWVFVGPEYLYHPHVYRYYEPTNTTVYIQRTNYINETYVDGGTRTTYYYGPRREEIERESHRRVTVYNVSNASAPGATHVERNSVQIYRPAVNRESATSARPASVVQSTGHPVGHGESYAPAKNQQPAFHQETQRQNPGGNSGNHMQSNQQQNIPQHQQSVLPSNPSNVPQHQQSVPQNNQATMPEHNQPMPQNNQATMPQHNQPMPQNNQATMPQHNQPMPQNNQATMPQHNQPMPQNNQATMPQHNQPMPQNNQPTMPQHNQPMPQNNQATMPQHNQPMPQNNQATMPQHNQPQMQQQPHSEPPHQQQPQQHQQPAQQHPQPQQQPKPQPQQQHQAAHEEKKK